MMFEGGISIPKQVERLSYARFVLLDTYTYLELLRCLFSLFAALKCMWSLYILSSSQIDMITDSSYYFAQNVSLNFRQFLTSRGLLAGSKD